MEEQYHNKLQYKSISHMQMEQMKQMTKMEHMHTREQGAFTVG